MGLGNALTNVFGGGNDYQYQAPPTLGAPGSTPQQQYQNYMAQNAAYGNQALPQNVLNMNQANNVNNRQNVLDNRLSTNMNQDINFGTQGSMGQQQGLIDQILQQGQGFGPNPALDQLRMTTDQNTRAAAGLIGSQHGNPALGLRLASQNMAGANQQAAGQGALQAAQQQIAAQQLGGGLLGQQIGQQTQQGALNAQNQQQYAALLAQQLGQQRGQDIQQSSAQGQAGLGLLGQRDQAQQNYQNMVNGVYSNMNNVNAGVAAQNAQTAGTYGQAGMAGISSALGSAASGGTKPMNQGGMVNPFQNHVAQKLAGGGTAGSYMAFQGQDPMSQFLGVGGNTDLNQSSSGLSSGLATKLHSLFASPQAMGDFNAAPAMASEGGKILGKAKVDADSLKNDNVPALLSPGEVVIPRSAMKSSQDAHAFLDKIMQQNEGPNFKAILKQKEKLHMMAHGGEMQSCNYCNGGVS